MNEPPLVVRVYLKSIVVLLVIVACGKAAMTFGGEELLDAPTPLFDIISNRVLFALTALLEGAVACTVYTCRNRPTLALVAVIWLAMLFIAYRVALWAAGFEGQCECLGAYSELLNLSAKDAGRIAKGMLSYMCAGSVCGLALVHWKRAGL